MLCLLLYISYPIKKLFSKKVLFLFLWSFSFKKKSKIKYLLLIPQVDKNNEAEEADEADEDDVPNVESPSPPLEIEGVVKGDPENDQLQSEGGGFTEDNNKVRFPI